MKFVLALVALLSGMALTSQVGMNNALRSRMGHPLLAAITSFGVGTIVLALYIAATRPGWPDRRSLMNGPWWMWIGGVVGAAYVASAAAFSARLGAAAWFGLIVTGQVLASLMLDHYGLLGFPRRPLNPARFLGALLLLAGVILVLNSGSGNSSRVPWRAPLRFREGRGARRASDGGEKSREQPEDRRRLDQLAGLVQMVQDHRARVDPERVINRRQDLGRMHGVFDRR